MEPPEAGESKFIKVGMSFDFILYVGDCKFIEEYLEIVFSQRAGLLYGGFGEAWGLFWQRDKRLYRTQLST
jgi:hypothetical protein